MYSEVEKVGYANNLDFFILFFHRKRRPMVGADVFDFGYNVLDLLSKMEEILTPAESSEAAIPWPAIKGLCYEVVDDILRLIDKVARIAYEHLLEFASVP